jgi:hypothetical protein
VSIIESKHGGKRPGAGRPTKYGTAMVQKTSRLPEHWITKLIEDFGTYQNAIETLVARYMESKK